MKRALTTLISTIPIFFKLLIFTTYAQNNHQLYFERITHDKGLAEGFVSGIFQDKKRIIWFTRGDGLNKYDGYTFTVYHSDSNDLTSLGSDDLACVFEDSKGRLLADTRQHGIEDKTGTLWIRATEDIDEMEIVGGKSLSLLQQEVSLWNQYTLLFSHIILDSTPEAGKKNIGPKIYL
ncbi:hypothetical protein [Segetibacter koreensis]|uniref:hypothetical protein n=1 Tax=Segetibacter koreensis TaxID=398037 RepID=UPI0012FBF162|nr:hypothetical protein [Segetibacter koreensis]